jgi:hypothetical protein
MVSFWVFTSCSKGLFWCFEGTRNPRLWGTRFWLRSMLNTKAHTNDIHAYICPPVSLPMLALKTAVLLTLNSHLLEKTPHAQYHLWALIGQTSYKVSQIINIFLLKCMKVLTEVLSCAGNPWKAWVQTEGWPKSPELLKTKETQISKSVKVKVKCTLVQALRLCTGRTAHRVSRCIALPFLEGGEGSASRPGRSLPPEKTRFPLYRRLGGPQGRSGQARKILLPPGFDPRTVQPVARCYTDWATWPTRSVKADYTK